MNYAKNVKIGVLYGGLSKEREVSLRTGKAMANGLRNAGYTNVLEIDVDENISATLKKESIQVAMLALHGRYGEDGVIQGVLEQLKIPYTGSGVMGSAISMNKIVSKELFELNKVRTPAWLVSNRLTDLPAFEKEVAKKLKFPCIAKPVNEGSTIGLSVVNKKEEIRAAHDLALKFDSEVLWEEFIKGTELTVGFLKGEALPIVEIVPKKGLFDFEAKYTKGMTEYFCPARVSSAIAKKTQLEAAKAFKAVHADSFGRVDLIWSGGKPWVLEVNTIPGMTETSLLPKAVKAAGMTFEQMVQIMIEDARLKA